MFKKLIDKRILDFDKALDHFHTELASVRTGRASAALVENILVESYGSKSPIKNLASITIPEARTITIQPWDKALLSAVEKAIQSSQIGIQPVNDGQNIRLNLPQPTEERRKEMIKVIKQNSENTRVRVRTIREEIWKEINTAVKEKKLTEDQKFQAQEEIKKIIDNYNKKIEDLLKKKEEEIKTV